MHSDEPTLADARRSGRFRRTGTSGRLLDAVAQLAQGKARLAHHSEKAWASITFAGARHRLVLEFRGEDSIEAGECFIAFLPEHEFAIPGHLVADAAVTEVDHSVEPALLSVTCELLLLEES